MPYHRCNACIAEGVNQTYGIAHVVDESVRQQVIVKGDVCSGASSIAALIRCNDIEPRRGESVIVSCL